MNFISNTGFGELVSSYVDKQPLVSEQTFENHTDDDGEDFTIPEKNTASYQLSKFQKKLIIGVLVVGVLAAGSYYYLGASQVDSGDTQNQGLSGLGREPSTVVPEQAADPIIETNPILAQCGEAISQLESTGAASSDQIRERQDLEYKYALAFDAINSALREFTEDDHRLQQTREYFLLQEQHKGASSDVEGKLAEFQNAQSRANLHPDNPNFKGKLSEKSEALALARAEVHRIEYELAQVRSTIESYRSDEAGALGHLQQIRNEALEQGFTMNNPVPDPKFQL